MPETRFLPLGLYWRLVLRTERALGRLPMLLLIPVGGAFVGTAWSVTHPSLKIENGLIVGQASFWEVLLGALVGGVVIFFALIGVMFAVGWFYYRVLDRGDDVWEAVYVDGNFELRCKAENPVHVRDLGAVECRVRMPSGAMLTSDHAGVLMMREQPVQGYIVRFELPKEAGMYEARWYAMDGERKLHEIARIATEQAKL
jgi:hypothetical protein